MQVRWSVVTAPGPLELDIGPSCARVQVAARIACYGNESQGIRDAQSARIFELAVRVDVEQMLEQVLMPGFHGRRAIVTVVLNR